MLIIKILNDGTGDLRTGNYLYSVYVNENLIALGKIKNHKRAKGWRNLVKMIIKQEEKQDKKQLNENAHWELK